MRGAAVLAEVVRQGRQPLPEDDPLLARERALFAATTAAIEGARRLRDAFIEQAFSAGYGARPEHPAAESR
jgi:hypothetical protein